MTRAGERSREASSPNHLLTAKAKTRIGTWNVRPLYERGKSAQIKRGADAAIDHHLLVATMKIKLRSFHDSSDRSHHKFNVQFLRDRRMQEELNCEVGQPLDRITRDAKDCLHTRSGKKGKRHKECLTLRTWQEIEERKELKKTNQCQDQQEKKSSEQSTGR
ncbi:hypothetical protein C0Q70_15017 [Pomacea canaliculata]|uniref:Uncharacterized protein n=1 Tax=Pomacea canaliculata TaxID=400727 RepID=A0A2T7NTQ1_POMCA|nr:hypothetical protein C0Q70_15017 [Pomacea canaliculata]